VESNNNIDVRILEERGYIDFIKTDVMMYWKAINKRFKNNYFIF